MSAHAPTRLHSLDTLRGFDLLWILGADTLVHAAAKTTGAAWLRAASEQLRHVPWAGLHAYDLVFPLFMFLSGVAIPYAFDGKLDRGELSPGAARLKILRRAGTLFLLGLVYNGALAGNGAIRLPSVLAQIGFAYAGTAMLHLAFRRSLRARLSVLALLVAGISALHLTASGDGPLTAQNAINAVIDRAVLPGRLHGGDFDPEGLLCVIASTALTLGGAITGSLLRRATDNPWRRATGFALAGAACIAAGHAAWALGYPPIKALWTGSFVLLALGWSLVAFAAAHALVDLAGIERPTRALRAIGMNSLALYLGVELFPPDRAADLLFGRLAGFGGAYEPALRAAGALLVVRGVAGFLRRKNILITV